MPARLKQFQNDLLVHGAVAMVVLPPLVWLLLAVAQSAGQTGRWGVDAAAAVLLERSLKLAGCATALALFLGVPFGWLTARRRMPAAGFLAGASLLPLLLPPYAASFAGFLFLSREGWLNTTLMQWGWIAAPLEPFRSFGLAVWVLGSSYWPVLAWFTRAAARSVPQGVEDAARLSLPDAAAARWAAAPAVLRAVGAGGLLVFLISLADFGVPNSLGLGTYPVEIVNQFQFDRDPGRVARLALPLLALVVPLVALQVWLLGRTSLVPAHAQAPRRYGQGGWLAALWCGLVLAVTSLLPLGVLAFYSMPAETYAGVWAESAGHFANTLLSAGGGALLALGVALAHGWLTRGRVPPLLDLAFTLTYALPGSLVGVAMIQILNRPGPLGALYTSMGGLVWTYAALLYPFAYKSLQPVWGRLDPELLDEGAALGAGSWAQFRATAWPVARPYALTGAALVSLLAAREMDATALLRIPGGDTLAFRIHDYLHFAPTPKVAALCLLIVLLSGGVVGLTARLLRAP